MSQFLKRVSRVILSQSTTKNTFSMFHIFFVRKGKKLFNEIIFFFLLDLSQSRLEFLKRVSRVTLSQNTTKSFEYFQYFIFSYFFLQGNYCKEII